MSELMKAQYQALAELRGIDEKVARIQVDIERIPEEEKKLTNALNTQKEQFEHAKVVFAESEKKVRRSEADLKEKEDKLTKAEDKMREVKTNEEYQAALKENESQKKEKGGVEDQAIGLMGELDKQKAQLKEAEKKFKDYEEAVTKDISKLEQERLAIAKNLEEILAKRDEKTSMLSSDTKALYLKIGAARGFAVVGAENGMCTGCNMRIRPQLYNEILGYKAIHTCPSCRRIVIVMRDDHDANEANASAK